MLGTKLYKNNKTDMDNYTQAAEWCNANGATIKDRGEYYEILLEYDGVEYSSFEDAAYLAAKAADEEAARVAALQPTEADRLDAIEAMLLEMQEGE